MEIYSNCNQRVPARVPHLDVWGRQWLYELFNELGTRCVGAQVVTLFCVLGPSRDFILRIRTKLLL